MTRKVRVRTHPQIDGEFTCSGDDVRANRRQSDVRGRRWRARNASARAGLVLLVLALLAAGCGGPQPASVADVVPVAQPTTSGDVAADGHAAAASSEPADDAGAVAGADTGADAGAAAEHSSGSDAPVDSTVEPKDAPARTGKKPGAGAPAAAGNKRGAAADESGPDMDAVDVSATLDPECVRPGGSVTITIASEPHASVAYNAIYADGQAGAPAPFGANYGGNAGGPTGEEGLYRDTWTVAANAPSGPGHVEVVAGASGGGFGKTTVPFAVADAVTGTCG
jgi:hypothetical protein